VEESIMSDRIHRATFSVSVPASLLRAVATCASWQETRFYLKGVLFEGVKGAFILVATDGSRMAAARIPYEDEDTPLPIGGKFIVPLHIIKQLPATKKSDAILTVRVSQTDDCADVEIDCGGTLHRSPCIDGSFPDWRRVIPTTATGKPGHFNAAFVADFQKMAALLGAKEAPPFIHHNGDDPALVSWLPQGAPPLVEAFGVICPMRRPQGVTPAASAPAWAVHSVGASDAA
jgi:hypothetical protein